MRGQGRRASMGSGVTRRCARPAPPPTGPRRAPLPSPPRPHRGACDAASVTFDCIRTVLSYRTTERSRKWRDKITKSESLI